ncbi:DUF3999 family protein, partial [Ectothiorhodospiraceae bacterium WFHF3C12]|nr:DUF3999 family protein [Ectothiorhodospiraceae bacterium WFHF3C12]
RLGRQPQRLYFVAQGPGPYTLAFGSAAQARTLPKEELGEGLLRTAEEDEVAAATAGQRVELGGPSRLQPGPGSLPWTRILLWAVLLAAVAVLAFMAWRLYKQIGGADAA